VRALPTLATSWSKLEKFILNRQNTAWFIIYNEYYTFQFSSLFETFHATQLHLVSTDYCDSAGMNTNTAVNALDYVTTGSMAIPSCVAIRA
jgi:hypothetical protein